MAKTDTAPKGFKIADRVIVTRDLPGIAEGSRGRVRVVNGITWPRYWVEWETGEWRGTISGADLVRERDWEAFKVQRAEEASRPKVAAAAAPVAAASSGDGAAAGGGRVPAHLLERSEKARARKAASAADGG